jgi:hypothetical protein
MGLMFKVIYAALDGSRAADRALSLGKDLALEQ